MWYRVVTCTAAPHMYLIHIVVYVNRHFPLLYGIHLQHSYIFFILLFYFLSHSIESLSFEMFSAYLKPVENSKCENLTNNLNNFTIFNSESDYQPTQLFFPWINRWNLNIHASFLSRTFRCVVTTIDYTLNYNTSILPAPIT